VAEEISQVPEPFEKSIHACLKGGGRNFAGPEPFEKIFMVISKVAEEISQYQIRLSRVFTVASKVS
jgi:hypothetical protein